MTAAARISVAQLIFLTSVYTETALVVFLFSPIIRAGQQDAWAGPLLALLSAGVPIALLLGLLAKYHPHKGFTEIAVTCLGRWPGKALGGLHALFSLFLTSLVIRNVMDFTVVSMMTYTPIFVLGLLFALTIAYPTIQGGEVTARLAVFIFLVKASAVVLIPLALMGEMDFSRLRPFLTELGPALAAAYPPLGWYAQTIVLAAFLRLLHEPARATAALIWGLIIGTLVVEGLLNTTLLTFGSFLAQRFTFPVYALVQQLSIGMFAERMEIILITVWLMGMVIQGAACLWAATSTAADVLGLKSDRAIVFPMTGFALGLTYLWPSFMALASIGRWWGAVITPIAILVPALLAAISWWRSRKRQGVAA